ncbi:Cytochrome P450-DIT2 [Madurella mycetomatis]|uniref:Cytochrome P450-DIT2 n=1 Tax=Madurella mycetomatis TaxID=100816 RepID=A0A175VQC2_9PEZI|nr:Cytochrome P450-DIT2 [Madurella mycetomatis]KXX79892.1 Cytochrome P450-DIT2 [Madurella mycetomatis]
MADIVFLFLTLLVGVTVSVAIAGYVVLVPPKYPKGIPAVPFWVTLIPFFKDVDQSETFKTYIEEPLRTHGAVKLFFGAQWNVLVHRPRYLAELFKHEDIYQKSGNQKKIPNSVLAAFLGDNIISSHGSTWKQYRQVIKPGLQRTFEIELLARNAVKLCNLIGNACGAGGRGVPVQDMLQRYTISNIGDAILQTDFGALDHHDAKIHKLQTALKLQIFKPIFMNFPFLDSLPIPSRLAVRSTISEFKDELTSSLVSAHAKSDLNVPSDKLGARLLAARGSGELTEQQFRDNLTVLYVAGQENPQIGLISTLYLLAQHPEVQDRLLDEIRSAGAGDPTHSALQGMPYLASVVYESLRMLPPIGQLINRRAAEDVLLGDGVFIPKGTYLGYHCYSTNRDAEYWGPDADRFRPERWGQTMEDIQRFYRQRRTKAEFVTFHGGNRACLGERFATLELKVTLFALTQRFTWRLDPTWPNRMTP